MQRSLTQIGSLLSEMQCNRWENENTTIMPAATEKAKIPESIKPALIPIGQLEAAESAEAPVCTRLVAIFRLLQNTRSDCCGLVGLTGCKLDCKTLIALQNKHNQTNAVNKKVRQSGEHH